MQMKVGLGTRHTRDWLGGMLDVISIFRRVEECWENPGTTATVKRIWMKPYIGLCCINCQRWIRLSFPRWECDVMLKIRHHDGTGFDFNIFVHWISKTDDERVHYHAFCYCCCVWKAQKRAIGLRNRKPFDQNAPKTVETLAAALVVSF